MPLLQSIFHVPIWPFLLETASHTPQPMPPTGPAAMYLHH
eukprot:COSAG04_NODE_29134_length_271_cov_0.593023_1_plen_39_part_01